MTRCARGPTHFGRSILCNGSSSASHFARGGCCFPAKRTANSQHGQLAGVVPQVVVQQSQSKRNGNQLLDQRTSGVVPSALEDRQGLTRFEFELSRHSEALISRRKSRLIPVYVGSGSAGDCDDRHDAMKMSSTGIWR